MGKHELCRSEISDSYGGKYEDDSLLGYTAMIALMMEAVPTSETSVYFNDTTLRYTPQS
jgi:hypothetical protein